LHDVDADGFFAVDVLARGDRGFKVLYVEEWWRGYLDEVDVGRSCELFEGMWAAEEQLAVNGRLAEAGIELVEVIVTRGEVVGEEIGEGHDAGGGIFRERCGDTGAAIAASQQSMAHRRVRFVSKC